MWKFKLAILSLLCLLVIPVQAQVNDLLTISVEAGYGGFYRPDYWTPLRVTIENRGAGVRGRVVVRPETSAGGLSNAYSLPVDLPPQTGGNPIVLTDFLYAVLDGGDTTLRVELLNDDGNSLASRDVSLRDLGARDALYVVLSESTNLSNPITLDETHAAGYEAFTIYWQLDNLPDRAGGLDAVNAVVFNDIDTSALDDTDAVLGTSGIQEIEQKAALRSWILGGGHLIATGGIGWETTASGLRDLLPIDPQDFNTAEGLTTMARFAADYETRLDGEYFLVSGDVTGDVLLANDTGDPLIVRRNYGNGTVDYLTVDPNSTPLVNWDQRDSLWFTLLTSAQTRPNWSYGFSQWNEAVTAMEILPGVDLLPAVMTLVGFLVAYVVLIGPVNYIILNRLNRRGYAWITIPVLIGIFSYLAFQVGFDIRGSDVLLSRLSVVQTWEDSEQAQVHQLVGLLAPRRGEYTLSVDDGFTRDNASNDPLGDTRLLRPVGRETTIGSFTESRTAIEIQEGASFSAVDFPVDASFIAGFSTTGALSRPDIGGLVTVDLSPRAENEMLRMRGSVRNDSDITLHDPVILARGVMLTLNETLLPGDQIPFDTDTRQTNIQEPALPANLEYARDDDEYLAYITGGVPRASRPTSFTYDNVAAILRFSSVNARVNYGLELEDESDEYRRRRAFLWSFVVDQYGSTGRGNSVYLVGWADESPYRETVPGETTGTIDTTLYIIELDVQLDIPRRVAAVVTEDQFSWVSISRTDAPNIGITRIDVDPSADIAFRFTPQPGAILNQVNEMDIIYNRSDSRVSGNFELWNWEAGEWELFRITADRITIDDPARFLGPLNAVQVRATPRADGGNLTVVRIGVEQRGSF
mgnify:CR=1 FL=1